LIESLALSASLIAVLSIIGAFVYFGLIHVGANYLLHEFLVCEVTQGEQRCQKDFRERIQTFLFAAQLTSFRSSKVFDKQRVRITLKMPMNRRLTMQKELEWYR
jgi:hypothetical protein